MNTKMKLKNILTISLAVLLTACTHPSNSVPIQANDDGYSEYQNPPIDNPSITNTEALAVGAVGVATGYAVGKYANKPRYGETRTVYGKPKASYGKPVVVVNKHYYQGSGSRTKYKSTYRKRK